MPLTFSERKRLKAIVGEIMRKRFWREKRMNLWGEERPIEARSFKSKAPQDEDRGVK